MSNIFWMCGLSGAGKTTLAKNIQVYMKDKAPVFILDGDDIRSIYPAGFSPEERNAHLLRSAQLAKLMASQGINVIASFITPFESTRLQIRSMFDTDNNITFKMIYVNASLKACSERDVKGLYKNNPAQFTGISQSFEPPINFDLELKTDKYSIAECLSLFHKAFPEFANYKV